MALQRKEILIDDLDGTEAIRTVYFALDGVRYRIELSRENNERLRSILAPYRVAGRLQQSVPRKAASIINREYKESRSKAARELAEQRATRRAIMEEGRKQREYRRKVREWAIANGLASDSSARATKKIIAAYEQAHS